MLVWNHGCIARVGPRRLDLALLAAVTGIAFGVGPVRAASAGPDFGSEVRPILQRCLPCHGPDDQARMANLRLDTHEGATGESGGYRGIVPGASAASRVIARVSAVSNPMPPSGERLTPDEIETLKSWIDAGAGFETHWAFEAPQRSAPPEVSAPTWVRSPIDSFILARLEEEGLAPSPQASRYTLARRLSLDLTGLPPHPDDVERFINDGSPSAYETYVDKLLNSSTYGERWARVWLDLARYADSMGYEKDTLRTIWPYRDWVVQALNDNMPFDRFTITQLAGDLLPEATDDDLVATGFHRNTMTNTEGGTDDEEFRDAAVKDRVATTGQTWMGLTVGCAQCHTHKYDPISQSEFYSLYAFFNQTADADKNDDSPILEIANGVSTPIFRELPVDSRRETFVHESGNFMNRGATVEASVPAAFHPLPQDVTRNRLGLAQWLVSPDNPLTARVTVNRLWARLFGKGIVATEGDFGTQGSIPTHPGLLNWLALEFMDQGWDVKRMLRAIVTSSTYRQQSTTTPAILAADPDNALLSRGARFRLAAETVRDQALAVGGLLSGKVGGKPVMPWQPEGIWQVVYSSNQWQTSPGEDRYRRSLYTLWRRTAPYPSMTTFDAPSGETCTIRRIRTNTPLQALVSLNDPTLMEAAQHLAARTSVHDDLDARVKAMYRYVLSRPPSEGEVERVLDLRHNAARELARDSTSARQLTHFDRVLYQSERRRPVLRDSRTESPVWRYTTEEEPPADWSAPSFDATAWTEGPGSFGWSGTAAKSDDPYSEGRGTRWESDDLWMRIEFELDDPSMTDHRLEVRFSGAFETFINGLSAVDGLDGSGTYSPYKLSAGARNALRPGRNVLAVHATHTGLSTAGRHIDVGMSALESPRMPEPTPEDADEASWVVVANVLLNLDETLMRQ